MVIFVDCMAWVEVTSYEPHSHLNFIIAKICQNCCTITSFVMTETALNAKRV